MQEIMVGSSFRNSLTGLFNHFCGGVCVCVCREVRRVTVTVGACKQLLLEMYSAPPQFGVQQKKLPAAVWRHTHLTSLFNTCMRRFREQAKKV